MKAKTLLFSPAMQAQLLGELRPAPCMELTEWSEAKPRLPVSPLVISNHPIRWNRWTFPLQAELMRVVQELGRWRQIVIQASPQTGKSAFLIFFILWSLFERRQDGGYVNTSASASGDFWNLKILPVIKQSRALADYLPDMRNAGNSELRRSTNGKALFVRGSDSAGQLDQWTAQFGIADDVQGMREIPNRGHPVALLEMRLSSYAAKDRTLILAGTAKATNDYLTQARIAGTNITPQMPCPKCGHYQAPPFTVGEFLEHSKFDSTDAVTARATYRLVCRNAECRAEIACDSLPWMLERVRYPARGQTASPLADGGRLIGDPPRTDTWSIQWNRYYWPMDEAEWGNIAALYVESRGKPQQEMEWAQNQLNQPFDPPTVDEQQITAEIIMAENVDAKGVHRRGVVPAGVIRLALGVDVQEGYLYWALWGWDAAGSSWLIDAEAPGVHGPKRGENISVEEKEQKIQAGIFNALEALHARIEQGWEMAGPPATGTRFRVAGGRAVSILRGVDAGHLGTVVRIFSTNRAGFGWLATIGARVHDAPMFAEKLKTTRDNRSELEVGTVEVKHLLRQVRQVAVGSPGYMQLYNEGNAATFAAHLASESWIGPENNKKWVNNGGPNHWLDATVYAWALALRDGQRVMDLHQRQQIAIRVKPVAGAGGFMRTPAHGIQAQLKARGGFWRRK